MQTESCREVAQLFKDRFPDIDAPHRDTVHKLVNRFREMGSDLDRKPQRTCHVLTEENLDEIGQTLQRSPIKSQETGVSQFSAWKATRLWKLKPMSKRTSFPTPSLTEICDCCNCKFA